MDFDEELKDAGVSPLRAYGHGHCPGISRSLFENLYCDQVVIHIKILRIVIFPPKPETFDIIPFFTIECCNLLQSLWGLRGYFDVSSNSFKIPKT